MYTKSYNYLKNVLNKINTSCNQRSISDDIKQSYIYKKKIKLAFRNQLLHKLEKNYFDDNLKIYIKIQECGQIKVLNQL